MNSIKEKVLYRVNVIASQPEVGERFYQWMLEEHGDDLLKIPGCIECRVYRKSPVEFENHYIFESQEMLQDYYKQYADTLRAKAKVKFVDGELQFQRDEALLVAEGNSL